MKKIVALVLCLALALALCTVAFADNGIVYLKDVYAKGTGKGAEATSTNVRYYPAHEEKDDKGNVTEGNIAFYTVDSIEDAEFALVDSLAKADVVISVDKDGKNVVMYLDLITSDVEYTVATAVTNVGTKCGQYNIDAKKSYYVDSDDVVYVADKDGDETLKVGDKFVTAFETEIDLDDVKVPHVTIPVLDPAKGVVGYKCANCGLVAVEAPNYASIPANADQTGLTGNWYWPAAAAATTTGVTSAKTFDAGVAMYAGLALMSVAGSAVVIGKKKEF